MAITPHPASGASLSPHTGVGGITTHDPVISFPVEYLVVAGGGGGGSGSGTGSGPGGAGGLLTGVGLMVFRGDETPIVVGAGGASDSNGGDSSFLSIVATGGGHGSQVTVDAGNGGSGGGAGSPGPSGSAGSGVVSQGTNGGVGYGGGASGTPNGYTGVVSSISGASVTYATGGTSGTPAANTGDGGGHRQGFSNLGKPGGSGVVILRYSDSLPAAIATTGTPTITVAGGYRVYKFTQSGSITL